MPRVFLFYSLLGLIFASACLELSQAKESDVGLLATGKGGAPFQDCSRSIRVSGSVKIPVCLVGDGMYSQGAIQEMISKDWFSGDALVASQIEEVRFVCRDSFFGWIGVAQVLFPNKKEALAGRRVRIEIPCDLDRRNAAREFQKMVELVRKSVSRPDAVVEDTKQVKVACDKNPKNIECRRWKNYLGDILSGEVVNRMVSTMSYCGTNFTVGLAERQVGTGEIGTVKSGELSEGLGLEGMSDIEIQNWVKSHLLHCSSFDQAEEFNFEKCREESRKLRVRFGKSVRFEGAVAWVDGKRVTCSTFDELTEESQRAIKKLLCAEERSGINEMQKRIEDHSLDIDQVRVSPAEWDDVIDKMGIRKGELHQVENEGDYARPISNDRKSPELCGMDLECWKRFGVLEKANQKNKRGQYPVGCYRLVGIKGSSVADFSVEFAPATGCPPVPAPNAWPSGAPSNLPTSSSSPSP